MDSLIRSSALSMRTERIEDLALCANPGGYENAEVGRSERKRRRETNKSATGGESLAGMLRRGIVNHQLGLSLNLILLVGMSWCVFPSLRNKLEAFFWLSYRTTKQADAMFGQGPRDLNLVIGFVVLFTGLRAFMLDHVLMPLAGALGVRQHKGRVR